MSLTFTEYPNMEVLKEVLELPFVHKEDKTELKAYHDRAIRGNGSISLTYTRKSYNGTQYGRLYPDTKFNGRKMMSGQGMWRHVRTALFADKETDVDIVNCHANILQHLCRKHNIKKTPLLDAYVHDRDAFIANNMSITDNDVFKYNQETKGAWSKKDLAKAVVSATVCGCRDYKQFYLNKSPYKVRFVSEMTYISGSIIQIPDYAKLIEDIKVERPDSHAGSWMSFIIQSVEFPLVMSAIETFQEQGVEVTIPIHDGFQVRSTDVKLIDAILQQINSNNIVKFIRKPFSTSVFDLDIEAEEGEVEDSAYPREFMNMVATFERTHAKISAMSKFIMITSDGYIFKSKQDMITSYENMWYTSNDGKDRIQFIKTWLTYPEMKTYENIGMFPPGVPCPTGWFNAWKPFPIELLTNEGLNVDDQVDMILNHVKILSDHDEAVYRYLLAWIGHAIKYPSQKSACIILISKEGAGKGTLIYLFERMFGVSRILSTSTPSRDVWGQFNGAMEHAYIVNLDELNKKETLDSEGQIKKLITDPRVTINRKGVGQYEVTSYHRFIVTTNNEDPMRSGSDDRRKVIVRSSDELCPSVMGTSESRTYFTLLRKAIDNDDVMVALYKRLTQLEDLDNFNHWAMPKTEHQQALKDLSRTPVDFWLESYVATTEGDESQIPASEAYESFKLWCSLNKQECFLTNVKFSLQLKLLRNEWVQTGIKKKYGNDVKFNLKMLREQYGLIDELKV